MNAINTTNIIKKIAIYPGFSAPAKNLAARLKTQFANAGFTMAHQQPDLILTVGGDGALIRWARELDYPDIPFIGVNAGTVGFMQELEAKDIPAFLKELKRGDFKIIDVPLLSAHSKGQADIHTHAFNEIVIERKGTQAIHLEIYINGKKFERFVGDGLIFTTPQGSTAYGAAAGGAIFPLSVKAYQFVPSNPHDSVSNRTIKSPMLMPESAVVRVVVEDYKNRKAQVVSDGAAAEIGIIKEIDIKISRHRFKLLRTERFNFYERISKKIIGRAR